MQYVKFAILLANFDLIHQSLRERNIYTQALLDSELQLFSPISYHV